MSERGFCAGSLAGNIARCDNCGDYKVGQGQFKNKQKNKH